MSPVTTRVQPQRPIRPLLGKGPATVDAGALVLTRRRDRHHMVNCHNGCAGGASYKHLRDATHYAWLLGYKTPLCAVCAKAWPQLWAAALDQSQGKAAIEGKGA